MYLTYVDRLTSFNKSHYVKKVAVPGRPIRKTLSLGCRKHPGLSPVYRHAIKLPLLDNVIQIILHVYYM